MYMLVKNKVCYDSIIARVKHKLLGTFQLPCSTCTEGKKYNLNVIFSMFGSKGLKFS